MIIGRPPNGGDTYVWLEDDGTAEGVTHLKMGKSLGGALSVILFDEPKGMYAIDEENLEAFGFTTREIV